MKHLLAVVCLILTSGKRYCRVDLEATADCQLDPCSRSDPTAMAMVMVSANIEVTGIHGADLVADESKQASCNNCRVWAATGVSGEINIVQIGETKLGHQNQHHRQSQSRGQSRHLDGTEKLAIIFSIQVVDDRAVQVVQNKVTLRRQARLPRKS